MRGLLPARAGAEKGPGRTKNSAWTREVSTRGAGAGVPLVLGTEVTGTARCLEPLHPGTSPVLEEDQLFRDRKRRLQGAPPMPAIVQEWLNLILRWVHVLAAILWIGDSFL